ncbi:MAG: transcription antitermination factor NusB [Verrucomicrobiia bacterium]
MNSRRKAREAALQFLFSLDVQGFPPVDLLPALVEEFLAERPLEKKSHAFALKLIEGVSRHRVQIDNELTSLLANFQLHRLGVVDRSLLRLALFEIRFSEDVPPVVVINEAIEIAKKFGAEESARFINGVLDHAIASCSRNPRG